MKKQVIKALKDFGVDLTKIRVIKHGDYIDVYPKVPRGIEGRNQRRSRRRDWSREIITNGSNIQVPITERYHTTKRVVLFGFFDETIMSNEEYIKDACAEIESCIKDEEQRIIRWQK